jgi:hypothetical protein
MITAKSNSDDLQMPKKQTTPIGPKFDPPDRLSGDFRTHKLEKIVAGGKGEKSTLSNSVKCVLHIRREVQQDTFVNSALFHFTKGPVLKNITL